MSFAAPHPDEFIACVRREFSALTRDYGFAEIPNNARRYYNPVSARYENTSTLVIVEGIAHGFGTSIQLGRLPQPAGELDNTWFFWPLAELRQPKDYDLYRQTLGQLNQLPLLADLLFSSASDILRGDLRMVPYIQQTVDEHIEKQRILEAKRELNCTIQLADDAFREKRYTEVVTLLTSHEAVVSPGQSRKLHYARKHQ